ncbi:hypothetical protein J5N97_004267 [Dioscorea zingiberensis]|uniref:Pre-mRNA-processing factor 39 n=1 Tax=Dioscorea zingiberensis TaxID=325984 RepID=A0A9D5D5T7_9LILI|nr:hypothetical protein J5N97_004267 [Dioscorea zingiberensis]
MANSEGEADEMQQDATWGTPSRETDLFEAKLRDLVERNQIDFDTWTTLIAEIEKMSPSNIKRISQLYDYFLSEFPLCYGYWVKYANHKVRLCNFHEVQEIYERAVQVLAYSVDLWVNYCSFAVMSYENPADVRRLFERGLSFVGKDYLCHLLWDKYIEFEYSQKQWVCLAHIYINILRFPTTKLKNYYESFKKLCAIWKEDLGCSDNNETTEENVPPACEAVDVKAYKNAELSDIIRNLINGKDGHPDSNTMKKYLSAGELFYRKSTQIDNDIKCFEACIKRPYFHVKPLDDSQLDNWHKYLDFVELQGDFDWTVKLYERCLIACANYSEFWIRYVEFIDAKGGKEIANNALKRASTVYLKKNSTFHIYYTMYKEQVGDISNARAYFPQCANNSALELIENVNRQANMEKRMGNTGAAFLIYEKAIELATEKDDSYALPMLYSNFAQFTLVVTGNVDAAIDLFVKGVQQKPYKAIIEGLMQFLTMHGGAGQLPKVYPLVANLISPGSDLSWSLSYDDQEDISRLFLKFVDLYGTIHEIKKAWDHHWKLFPHVMRPSVGHTTTGKTTCDNIAELKAVILAASSHLVNKQNSPDGSDMGIESSSLGNITSTIAEGVQMFTSQAEKIRSTATGMLEHAENASEMQRESLTEGIELNDKVNMSVHEYPEGLQKPEARPEDPKTENQYPDEGTFDDIRPSIDNFSVHYPEVETQRTKPTTPDRTAPLEDSRSSGDLKDAMSRSCGSLVKFENEFSPIHSASDHSPLESHKCSSVNVSIALATRLNTPQPNLQKDDSPLHLSTDKTLVEAQRSPWSNRLQSDLHKKDFSSLHLSNERSLVEAQKSPQTLAQGQSSSNLPQASPVKGAFVHNSSNDENSAGTHHNGHAPEDFHCRSLSCVQSPQPQEKQVVPRAQYVPAVTNSQIPTNQSYPSQSQTTTVQQCQQANQIQVPQMAAAQVYPVSNAALPGQNMMQQGFVYAPAQPGTQSAAQPPMQVYQYLLQGNEQYGYPNEQGFPPHIWQYYQQQLYYLQQQQQNPQANQTQQQLHIEQLQQMQNMQLQQQQQQLQNQQQPHLMQQQNQHQVSQQEAQFSSQQEKHDQQQQQMSQYQQQNQQIHHQLQLMYLQQQQLYLHQQQLLLQQQQQQQQQQLLQQQQHSQNQPQQTPQQQQTLQERQIQQQQQQQQQQQPCASDLQASNNWHYLQQHAVHLQPYAANQLPQHYGQQAVTSQGEGSKSPISEQSASPLNSRHQQTPTQ